MLVSVFIALSAFECCRATSWIRHRWIGTTFQKNIDKIGAGLPLLDVPVQSLDQERRTALCDEVLNFRLYTIGKDEHAQLRRILDTIDKLRPLTAQKYLKLPFATAHSGGKGPVTVPEIACVVAQNIILTVSYFPFMPFLRYVRVSMLTEDIENASSALGILKSDLFALAEADPKINKLLTLNLEMLERRFLKSIHGEPVFPNFSRPALPYDIYTFDLDDRFRLCSTVFNAIMDNSKLEHRDKARIQSMPDGHMFNIYVENWVNLRFEHDDYKGDSVRTKMMTCQLSTYTFYLVADANEMGAVFCILHETLTGNIFEVSDLVVHAHIRSVPMLEYYIG